MYPPWCKRIERLLRFALPAERSFENVGMGELDIAVGADVVVLGLRDRLPGSDRSGWAAEASV